MGRFWTGIAVGLLLLLLSMTPALAIFQGINGNSGRLKSTTGKFATGGASLTCGEDIGTWKIRNPGSQYESQKETKTGPHLLLHIIFKNCSFNIGGLKLEAKLHGTNGRPECQLELKQPNKGETTAVLDFDEACLIEIPANGCVITWEQFNEKTGANFQLKTTILENKPENLLTTTAVEGITTSVNTQCETAGIKAGKEGKLVIPELVEGAKEI